MDGRSELLWDIAYQYNISISTLAVSEQFRPLGAAHFSISRAE